MKPQTSNLTTPPATHTCPECRGQLDPGFLQAPSFGIVWTSDPEAKWMPVLSRKVEKLQKDWWGFPKLWKEKLPALRCRKCKLVIFRYNAPESETANQ